MDLPCRRLRHVFCLFDLRYCEIASLRVEFLLKTNSGYPKDTGVNKPWQPLGIPYAITPIGQLHQSPPSPIPGDLGRGPSHQSTCSNIETYGQAQLEVCSKGDQGSSVDRPCQPSLFSWISSYCELGAALGLRHMSRVVCGSPIQVRDDAITLMGSQL